MIAAALLGWVTLAVDPAPCGAGPMLAASALQEPAPGALDALWSLLSPRADQTAFDEAALVRSIVLLGPVAARPALAIHLGLAEEPEPAHEVDPRALAARPRILLAALAGLPRASVLAAVDDALAGSDDVDRRLDLCRILGRLGGEAALERVLATAALLEPIQWERTFVQVPLQEALATLAVADPALGARIAPRVRTAPPPLAMILVRALADAGAAEAASEIARGLGRDARLDLCVVETLTVLGARAAGSLPPPVLALLRRQLEARDERLVRATSSALARLGDAESAEPLARLLDARSADVRNAAQAALKLLTAASLPPERAAWEEWLESERRWAAERLPEIAAELAEPDAAALATLIAELAAHRLHRHQAALTLAVALGAEDPAIATLVCAALPRFGSRAVVPALLAHAQDESSPVQAAAEATLRALEGPPRSASPPSAGS
ncbi:MAG: hypothetical protein JNK02_10605 [Planctomycetes bacterium]|nr:hypothetical protein [Planctomycetota bacterium]